MNVDRYTQVVLTVIAACLLWMCVMHTASPLAAQPKFSAIPNANVQPVVLVGTGTLDQSGTVLIQYVQSGSRMVADPTIPVALPYSAAKPMPVSLPYSPAAPLPTSLAYSPAMPLPVEVASVRKAGEWQPFRVAVEPAGVRRGPGDGSQ